MLNASASHLALVRTKGGDRCARALFALFIVWAFVLQSYAVQTHIHGLPGPSSSIAEFAKGAAPQAPTAGQSNKKHVPAQNDPDDCPLCQAVSHVNAVFFDAPVAIAPSILFFNPAIGIFEQDFPALYRGHDKEQRGPPRL